MSLGKIFKNPYVFFALYCGLYLAIRLIIPDSLSHDEAEQILSAQSFTLGFLKQPPLYSWMLWLISKFTALNLLVLTALKYILFYLFLVLVFQIAKKIYGIDLGYKLSLVTLFFVTYFYDFNRDLTHTILASTISAFAVFVYLKLIEKNTWTYQFYLGLSFALGLLSKYNFLFVIASLVLTSLFTVKGRKLLFSIKSAFSLCVFAFFASPHILWLYSHDFIAIDYAFDRANSMEKDFNVFATLKTLLLAHYESALVLILLFLVFRSYKFNFEQFFPENNVLVKNIQILCLVSLALPSLLIVLAQMSNFYSKWLSTCLFLVPILIFSLLDKQDRDNNLIGFFVIIALTIVLNASITFVGAFYPDLVGKIRTSQYPYRQLCSQIQILVKPKSSDFIYVIDEDLLKSNLSLYCEELNLKRIVNSKQYLEASNVPQHKFALYLWRPGVQMRRPLKKLSKKYQAYVQKITSNYINSKQVYELNYLIKKKFYAR